MIYLPDIIYVIGYPALRYVSIQSALLVDTGQIPLVKFQKYLKINIGNR